MSAPPYEPKVEWHGGEYFPAPYSTFKLPPTLRWGLVPVGILALASVLSTLVLICFILSRFVGWKSHYRTFIGYNQYVVLVLNLLLADLQQSASFLLSFHWIARNYILAPHPACFAQGWLLHSGDVGSGFFVMAIALHTFYTAVYGRRIGNKTFAIGIIAIWALVYFLTAIGLGLHGSRYFVRAGAWCWVSTAYEGDRLATHYIWIFVIQFATILIYFITFYQLRRKTSQLFAGYAVGANQANQATIDAVNRVTMLMTLYPCVYVVLTLPLSASRMWTMSHGGTPVSDLTACVTGALITSCGWVDTLLYTLTRKRLLKDTMSGNNSSAGRTAPSGHWEETELGSKGITHTRTVTVEGGQVLDAMSSQHRTRGRQRRRQRNSLDFLDPDRPPSPSESIDPILSGRGNGITKTEISCGIQEMPTDEEEEFQSDSSSARPPTYRPRGRNP